MGGGALFVILGAFKELAVGKGVSLIYDSKTLPFLPWKLQLQKLLLLNANSIQFLNRHLTYSHLAEYCQFLWIQMLLFQKKLAISKSKEMRNWCEGRAVTGSLFPEEQPCTWKAQEKQHSLPINIETQEIPQPPYWDCAELLSCSWRSQAVSEQGCRTAHNWEV